MHALELVDVEGAQHGDGNVHPYFLDVERCGTGFVQLYTGDSLQSLTTVPQSNGGFTVQAGITYHVLVETWSVYWRWELRFGNDSRSQAKQILTTSTSESYGNVGASKEGGEPDVAGNKGGASVWYRWQSPVTGSFTFLH